MVKQLKPSPLGARIAPPVPVQQWLWSDKRAYDAVLVPVGDERLDQLVMLLQHAGTLRVIDDLYCLVFDRPVVLDPAQLGAVLPVLSLGNRNLGTYDLAGMSSVQRGADRLHMVRQGKAVSYDLKMAAKVDPLEFWDFAGLEISRGMSLPRAQNPIKVPPQIASHNAPLELMAQAKPVYGDIRQAVDAAKSSDAMDHIRRGGRLLRSVVASLILIGLLIASFAAGLGIIVTGARGGAVGFFVALAVIYGLRVLLRGSGVFGDRTIDSSAGHKAGPPRGPGILDRLRSWAIWNTSLGDGFRADLARHLNDVSRMIERGEIDRALKRAISLGAQEEAEKKRNGFRPTKLPKPRASFDMDLSGVAQSTAPILSDHSYAEIADKYRQLAQKLSEDGDHRRAAFIYSELLSDVSSALSELEDIQAFEDAAKLATARKSPGDVTARLWFLAGKKDIALALARRFDAMEFIANVAEKTDREFAAFVRGHWIKDLIAAGDLSEAVVQSAGRPELETLHVAVTKQAVLAGLLQDAPVLIAATVSLDWRVDALNGDFSGVGASAEEQVGAYLHKLIHGADRDDAPARSGLIGGLYAMHPKDMPASKTVWAQRVTLLADAVIRATLAYDTDHPATPALSELRRLARCMNASVLAEDLRHVVRAKQPPQSQKFMLPPAREVNEYWTMIACVGRDLTLLGAKDGEMTLLDAQGQRCWTDHMSGLVGIVPIGAGRLVILVQLAGNERILTLLDTALHSYRSLGRTALVMWDGTATASTWLVQTPNAVGALDVAALLDDAPRFELLWSVTQTVPAIVLGFQMTKESVHWVSQRVNDGHPGLIETWALYFANQNLDVRIADPAVQDGAQIYQAQQFWTSKNHFWPVVRQDASQWQPVKQLVRLTFYQYQSELKIQSDNAEFFAGLTDFAKIIPVKDKRAWVVADQISRHEYVVLWLKGDHPYIVLEGGAFVAQSGDSNGRRHAIIDHQQRIILCDLEGATVTTCFV